MGSIVDRAQELHPNLMQSSFASELVLAADQFIIAPFSRTPDVIRSQALGNEPRTVIAGYHWFTDWGRDTMISLEGLTLIPGRIKEAEYILKTFALHIKEGLIPNMFPDKGNEGVYYTVDATLWFFHAIDRYYAYSKDDIFIKNLLPKLKEIINYHLSGTLYGIHVDPEDSLLTQGQKGYALTWMDAKVGDLVVTPREGKAVEINALWYNALCLLIEWIDTFEPSQNSQEYVVIAKQCYDSFNKKFWNEEGNCLYDLIEGKKTFDSSCRPNQLFSISLKYPILLKDKWEKVMEVIKNDLLTPYGMRTLSPKDPNYKIAYSGNLFLRDSAYHQGTIWPWLIGPYIDAFVKVYPDHTKDLKKILESFDMNMREGGIGTINEIFDGNEPYTHRGCIAQAWSVSEVLRSYLIILGKIDPI